MAKSIIEKLTKNSDRYFFSYIQLAVFFLEFSPNILVKKMSNHQKSSRRHFARHKNLFMFAKIWEKQSMGIIQGGGKEIFFLRISNKKRDVKNAAASLFAKGTSNSLACLSRKYIAEHKSNLWKRLVEISLGERTFYISEDVLSEAPISMAFSSPHAGSANVSLPLVNQGPAARLTRHYLWGHSYL